MIRNDVAERIQDGHILLSSNPSSFKTVINEKRRFTIAGAAHAFYYAAAIIFHINNFSTNLNRFAYGIE